MVARLAATSVEDTVAETLAVQASGPTDGGSSLPCLPDATPQCLAGYGAGALGQLPMEFGSVPAHSLTQMGGNHDVASGMCVELEPQDPHAAVLFPDLMVESDE